MRPRKNDGSVSRCGKQGVDDRKRDMFFFQPGVHYKCTSERCGCEWDVVEDKKDPVIEPQLPPTPPNRTIKLFGETKESKLAYKKYKEELAQWKTNNLK